MMFMFSDYDFVSGEQGLGLRSRGIFPVFCGNLCFYMLSGTSNVFGDGNFGCLTSYRPWIRGRIVLLCVQD